MTRTIRHPEALNNRILSSLPEDILDRLRPHLRPVSLVRNAPVRVSDGRVADIYFVNRGSISVLKSMRDGHTAQIRTIGIEGLTDPWALFGIGGARLDAVVQIPGTAVRISRTLLARETERSDRLQALLRAYSTFAIGDMARSSACNCLHCLDARFCRMLLVSQDNALTDTFELTHEHLATTLGVQRTGVTIAAGNLKRAGLIGYNHGRIAVLDRPGLRERTCECYSEMRGELVEFLDKGK